LTAGPLAHPAPEFSGDSPMAPEQDPKTMLKKEDWGGLTIVALLSVFVFPPYFIHLMTMAALTASSYLWTTRLSRIEQERFVAFEKEFRKGYKLQKAGRGPEALRCYKDLKKRYADHPQASHLVALQIEKLDPSHGNDRKQPLSPKKIAAKTKPGRS